MVEITGKYNVLKKVPTRLHTLDDALKGGLALSSAYEIYGFTHVGKSSLAYFLAGVVAGERDIALADFEHFDPDYLGACLKQAGFGGSVEILPVETGEVALTAIRDRLLDEKYGAAILDTVGALMPQIEVEGKITLEERIGLKPKLMARGMRAAMYAMKRNPNTAFFLLNHLHPIISLGAGATTSGGLAIHNLSAARLRLSPQRGTGNDGYTIIQGRVDKLRWGGKGGNFKFVIVPDIGIHIGLTRVIEADWYGLAKIDRTVKIGDTSYGYMKNIVKEARAGNDEFFAPFVEVVDEYKLGANAGLEHTQASDDSSGEAESDS